MHINYSALIFKSMDAAFLLAAIILGCAVLVLVIDLDTKRRLLEESLRLKEIINDGRIQTATGKGNNSNGCDHCNSPDNMVANGTAGMAEKSHGHAGNGTSKTTAARQRKTRNDNSSIPDGTSGVGA